VARLAASATHLAGALFAEAKEMDMAWSTIRLDLARNREFPEGSRHHGYLLHAPLTPEGRIDVVAYEGGRNRAVVEEFWGDMEPKRGRLIHRNQSLWSFVFGPTDEEPIFHFGDHRFAPGEYLTVRDLSGADLTFRVTTVVGASADVNVPHLQ
jgi:hypothetical protein